MDKKNKISYIYGYHSVKTKLELSLNALELLVSNNRKDKRANELINLATSKNIRIRYCSKIELKNMANTTKHQGFVLAYHDSFREASGSTTLKNTIKELFDVNKNPVLLIIDSVQDVGNFGACVRTAAASCVDLIITPKHNCAKNSSIKDFGNKASSGAFDKIKVEQTANLTRAIDMLKDLGFWIIGTAKEGSQNLYTYKFNTNSPIAIVLGSEKDGISSIVKKSCDDLIYIPTSIRMPQLNVSVACGVILFELFRLKCLQI